ncbi:radical SAM protein [Patescibacteria group bacterium]|nr:radical SAM protein [Patescibacteria group bacterium]MBU1499816.1 radical SAM protein [Patescibacteria group bacterium]
MNQAPTAKEVHTYIQINTTCNQKCVFCNRPPEIASKQVFKLENIKKRIKEISTNPEVARIIFTGGEPLLYPHLPEVIAWAKKYGFITEIQTNGTLLHTKITELKKAGLDIINFAFHSHKKNISNRLRGTKFGFEKIIKNLKLADKMGFTIHIIHVINSLNYQDLSGFIDYINHLNLQQFWLNLSLVVPEGWAWENKWIIPRMKDVQPYLIKAMENCKKYNNKFDISEIVPLCIVNGFEEHAISTLFKISGLEIIDDYLTGKRSLDFTNPTSDYAAKAPQCRKCRLNNICAGFYPRLKELYGVADFIPRQDDPLPVYKKLFPQRFKITKYDK